MDSVDLEVLKRCAEWLDAGRRVMLVTVVETWGSSPRPPGSATCSRRREIWPAPHPTPARRTCTRQRKGGSEPALRVSSMFSLKGWDSSAQGNALG